MVITAPADPSIQIKTSGLIDTGATGTGIRADLADRLGLLPRGQRRVLTANGLLMASEYLFRIGFICGNHEDHDFDADRTLPYMLEEQILGFRLEAGFAHPMLIGMDIIGANDLTITHDGRATLRFR